MPARWVNTLTAAGPHIRGGFVEDQDPGALQQRAGHAQQLPLAGAQVGAALNQLGIQQTLCSLTADEQDMDADMY